MIGIKKANVVYKAPPAIPAPIARFLNNSYINGTEMISVDVELKENDGITTVPSNSVSKIEVYIDNVLIETLSLNSSSNISSATTDYTGPLTESVLPYLTGVFDDGSTITFDKGPYSNARNFISNDLQDTSKEVEFKVFVTTNVISNNVDNNTIFGKYNRYFTYTNGMPFCSAGGIRTGLIDNASPYADQYGPTTLNELISYASLTGNYLTDQEANRTGPLVAQGTTLPANCQQINRGTTSSTSSWRLPQGSRWQQLNRGFVYTHRYTKAGSINGGGGQQFTMYAQSFSNNDQDDFFEFTHLIGKLGFTLGYNMGSIPMLSETLRLYKGGDVPAPSNSYPIDTSVQNGVLKDSYSGTSVLFSTIGGLSFQTKNYTLNLDHSEFGLFHLESIAEDTSNNRIVNIIPLIIEKF